jgi:hypothetical protein
MGFGDGVADGLECSFGELEVGLEQTAVDATKVEFSRGLVDIWRTWQEAVPGIAGSMFFTAREIKHTVHTFPALVLEPDQVAFFFVSFLEDMAGSDEVRVGPDHEHALVGYEIRKVLGFFCHGSFGR